MAGCIDVNMVYYHCEEVFFHLFSPNTFGTI